MLFGTQESVAALTEVSVGTPKAFVRSCHFGVDDLRRFAQLGVSVCVTAYPTTED